MDANDQHLRAGLGELVAAVLEPELRSMGASMGVLVWTTEPAGAAAGPSAPVAELLWSFGLPQELAHSWCRIPLDAPPPIAEAIRADRPVISAALTDRGRRYPTLAAVLGTAAEAMISVPARVPGPSWCAVVGALGVGFPRPRPVAPAEVAALAALADRGAGVLAAAGLLPCQSAELRPIGADEWAAVPRPGGPTVAAGAAGSDNRAGRAVPTGLSAPQEAGAGLGLGGVDLGLLETLLIHAPVGVAVLDRELRFVLVNPRAG